MSLLLQVLKDLKAEIDEHESYACLQRMRITIDLNDMEGGGDALVVAEIQGGLSEDGFSDFTSSSRQKMHAPLERNYYAEAIRYDNDFNSTNLIREGQSNGAAWLNLYAKYKWIEEDENAD